MNSHDRSKGAEPGFVVRCRTSGEGPLRQRATGWRRGGRTSAASLHHVLHRGGVSWPQGLWLFLTAEDWPMGGRKQGHQTQWPGAFLSGSLKCCVVWWVYWIKLYIYLWACAGFIFNSDCCMEDSRSKFKPGFSEFLAPCSWICVFV